MTVNPKKVEAAFAALSTQELVNHWNVFQWTRRIQGEPHKYEELVARLLCERGVEPVPGKRLVKAKD